MDLIVSPERPLDLVRFKSNGDFIFQCSDNNLGEYSFESGLKKHSYHY